MKALVAPEPDKAFSYYERIVAEKRNDYGSRVSHFHGRIEAAYSSYWEHRKTLEQLSPLPGLSPDERKLLGGCYDAPTRAVKPLKELMGVILARQTDRGRSECQLCGLNRPDTFDHYLPKAQFHEFAVCALNLVPCCPTCNTIRGNRPWRRNGERTALHLYFDEVETDVHHLRAEIVDSQKGYRVKYALVQVSGSPFARRYELHCKTFELLARFEKCAPGRLDTIRCEISDMSGRGYPLKRIAEELGRDANARECSLGVNHWEAALYRAASQAHDFIASALGDLEDPRHG
jgi:hypothetical protein